MEKQQLLQSAWKSLWKQPTWLAAEKLMQKHLFLPFPSQLPRPPREHERAQQRLPPALVRVEALLTPVAPSAIRLMRMLMVAQKESPRQEK